MKTALTTIGSRGDIQLYIALGVELQKNGHQVAILTHPWAEQIVKSYGLQHIPIGRDIDINYAARQFVEHSSNNLKGFSFALHFIYDNLRDCHEDLLSRLSGFDLVIGHGIVGEAEAEILDKPFITVSIAPMGLARDYGKSKNKLSDLAAYVSDKITGSLFSKPYLDYRKEMGIPGPAQKERFPYLAMIPMPAFLQKTNPRWKDKTEITGYFFAPTPVDYSPPEDLVRFIGNKEKPILVTFGSMFHRPEQTDSLFKTLCDALDRSHTRAILIMPDFGENTSDIPANVYVAKQIPYPWLLDHVTLVAHHFGFGTTAEVLKAGLPSIPIPHIFDQKIRASQVHKLGLAHKPLDMNKLDSETLSNAIVQVKNDTLMSEKCREAGNKISQENGTQKAVKLINDYITRLTR